MPMDQSQLGRLMNSLTATSSPTDRLGPEPHARSSTRIVLILLAAMLITALRAANADAATASRPRAKRTTPKPTTTKPATTSPASTATTGATTTQAKGATGSRPQACDLVTAAEAEVTVNTTHLVADATSSATDCAYRLDGVGNPRVLLSVRRFETKELFVQSRSSGGASSRAIPLAGVADVAYRSADWRQIEFLKGKTAVLIVMNVIDANGTFFGPEQSKALDAARVAASRA